jgi:hypothetical protein
LICLSGGSISHEADLIISGIILSSGATTWSIELSFSWREWLSGTSSPATIVSDGSFPGSFGLLLGLNLGSSLSHLFCLCGISGGIEFNIHTPSCMLDNSFHDLFTDSINENFLCSFKLRLSISHEALFESIVCSLSTLQLLLD